MRLRTSLPLLLLMILAAPPAESHHGRPYSQNVRAARAWLRDRTADRPFRCAHRLWENESGWTVRARGPMTRWGRPYGIPQALPARKMRAAGPDWRTNATTQVRWGTRYVRARYGSFCSALRFQRRTGWY